ncbi:DUF2752 domain-containing protein [Lacibacter luteus]|uniref:DUF2752 domain-containing protein n=1 Tax=Lacibacter luteus TaxID=2508719 RepID=A0A4Q1CKY3_9BACT|nr:DUF2752 domain-containing protein [Lacibacter luteus]RXK61616.1 DUF2752 domain-containing protein [Lacibacter luteus]
MQLLLSFFADIVLWLEKHMLTCPSRKFLHIDCPGCGLQRSYIALLKGNIAESIRLYPAAIPILLLFLYLLTHIAVRFKNGARILTIGYIFCALIIVVHYIYRVTTNQILH